MQSSELHANYIQIQKKLIPAHFLYVVKNSNLKKKKLKNKNKTNLANFITGLWRNATRLSLPLFNPENYGKVMEDLSI